MDSKENDGLADKRIYELELAKQNNEKKENVEEEFACLIEEENKEQKMQNGEESKVTATEGVEHPDTRSTQKGETGEVKTQTEEREPEEARGEDENTKTKLAEEAKVPESGRTVPLPAPEAPQDQETTAPNLDLAEAPEKRKMKKLKKMKHVKEEKAVLKQQRLADEEVRRKEINKQFGHLFFEREAEEGEENDVRPLKSGGKGKGKIEEEEGEDQDQDLEELIDRSFDGEKGEYDQETADRKFIEDMAKDSEKIMNFVRRQEERAKDLASGQELLKKDRRDRLDVIKQLMEQIKGDNGKVYCWRYRQ